MKKILILIFVLVASLYAKSDFVIVNENLQENTILVQKGSYKILEFAKMISKVKVNESKNIEVLFVNNPKKPLQSLKIYAKQMGNTTIFINFADQSNMQMEFSVIKDLSAIIKLAQRISPELIVDQANGEIILKGKVNTNKDKKKIIELFEKANVDITKDLIDVSVILYPDKMLRVKLHVAEIKNNVSTNIKNEWALNYKSTGSAPSPFTLGAFTTATTISGGLTAGANLLGSSFNTSAILNYLATENIVKVLDETTLITTENKEAIFRAGGLLRVKVQTTTPTGAQSSYLEKVEYGLTLNILVNEIIDNKYIDMKIITKSEQIDDGVEEVDGIPAISTKSVETFVLAKNKATIVLGGLVTSTDSKQKSKIPILGDIPFLGALFRSKDFTEGRSELVFFITPEIVDIQSYEQNKFLSESKTEITKAIKPKIIMEEKNDSN